MKSWLVYETRFRALAPALQHIRLDRQWGSSGEYWRLAGGSSTATQEFEALSTLAGRTLAKVLRPDKESDAALLSEPDDLIRWYRAITSLSGQFRSEMPAREIADDGSTIGHIFYGSLHNLAQNAGTACLKLQGTHPIPEKSRKQKIWDEYGSKILVGVILALVAAIIKLLVGSG